MSTILHQDLDAALRRGDGFAAATLRLVLHRAERIARDARRPLSLADIQGAAWAAREHFALELALLAQSSSLSGAGADSVIGELGVVDQLIHRF